MLKEWNIFNRYCGFVGSVDAINNESAIRQAKRQWGDNNVNDACLSRSINPTWGDNAE